PRPGIEPREHGYRCCHQRAGRCPCAHDIGGLGSHQRPAGTAFPGIAALVEDLLDRLPEGDRQSGEDCDISYWLLAEASKDLRRLKTLGSSSKPSRKSGD